MPSSHARGESFRDDAALAEYSPTKEPSEQRTTPLNGSSGNAVPATPPGTGEVRYPDNDIAASATHQLGPERPKAFNPREGGDVASINTHQLSFEQPERSTPGGDIAHVPTRGLGDAPPDTPGPDVDSDETIRLPPINLQSLAKRSAQRNQQFRAPAVIQRGSSLNISKQKPRVPITPVSLAGQERRRLANLEQKSAKQAWLQGNRNHQERPADGMPADTLSRLDTISMISVRVGAEEDEQQDIFINRQVEDITLKDTLELPSVKLVRLLPEQGTVAERADGVAKGDTERRKAVASTASGAAIAGIGDLLSALMRYITTVLMTNLFSPAIYGLFVETNAVITVLGYASKLGLDSATLRFLSVYRAKGERSHAAGLIRFASLVALVSGLIWGAAFFAASFLLAHFVFRKDVYALPFRESALLIPLVGMQLVAASGLQAFKAIKWKVYVDRLIQPGLTLILLVVFYFLGLRLEALIFATTCGFIASTITGQFFLQKAKRKLVHGVKPAYDLKTWAKFAFPMFFNSMIRNILNSTDILFLGAVATQSQIAFYGSADRVSYFVVAPLIALNAIFSPVISELHAKGQHKQLENMFKLVTKWSFSVSLPVFLCCLVFHDAILGIFTERYIAAGLVLVILAFGNLVDAGVGSVNYLLVMTGRPRVILTNTVTTVVLNIALALILVPRYNILGAAVAAALTVVILNIVGLIEVYWIMRIHPYRWDTLKPIAAGMVASVVGFLLNRVVHAGYGHRAIPGVVIGLLIPFVVVYVGMLAALRFSEEDMMVFDMIRAKFGKAKKKVV